MFFLTNFGYIEKKNIFLNSFLAHKKVILTKPGQMSGGSPSMIPLSAEQIILTSQ